MLESQLMAITFCDRENLVNLLPAHDAQCEPDRSVAEFAT